MKLSKEKYLRLFFIFILIIIFVSIISIVLNKIKKDAILAEEPITINLEMDFVKRGMTVEQCLRINYMIVE